MILSLSKCRLLRRFRYTRLESAAVACGAPGETIFAKTTISDFVIPTKQDSVIPPKQGSVIPAKAGIHFSSDSNINQCIED